MEALLCQSKKSEANIICERKADILCAGFYITLQSKQASSTVQPWVGRWRTNSFQIWIHAGSAEGAYISLLINCLPRTAYRLPSAKGDGEPSLNWMLSPQGYSTSWMKKCLGLWLTNLKGRLIPHPLIRCLLSGSIPGEKGRSCHIPSLHGRWSQCRQPLSEA